MMKRLLGALAVTTTLAAMGCGGENSCTASDECFRGEVCIDAVCQSPTDSNAANSAMNNVAANNIAANNIAANNIAANNIAANNVATNNTATNNTATNSTSTGLCVVDPFTAMCTNDDNDSFPEYIRTETGRGCLGGGDDFEGGEYTLRDQVICPLEAVDKFSTNLIPCDNITFIVEVTVIPHQPCDVADWDLNVTLQGNDCVEPNNKVRCEDLPDGSKRVTSFLEPSNSITSPYIDITPLRANMQFDYDVSIVVRE